MESTCNASSRSPSSDEIREAIAGKTLVSTFRETAAERADQDALRWKDGDEWRALTYADYADQATRVAAALTGLGVERGGRVALLLENRPEANIADLGSLICGAACSSIYNTSSPDQIRYVLDHFGAQVLIVDDESKLERVRAVRDDLSALRHVFSLDADAADGDAVRAWRELLDAGQVDLDEAADAVSPDDLATVIYTSGTTGPPKGAMHSHHTLMAATEHARLLFGEDFTGKRSISYLPFAHIAERLNAQYMAIRLGYEVSCCPEMDRLGQYLFEVRPHIFTGPPRIWEKLWAAIQQRLQAADAEERKAFDHALEVGREIAQCHVRGEDPPADLEKAWEDVQPQVQELRSVSALDAMEIAISAAAPPAQAVVRGMAGVDVRISDMYGATEMPTMAGDPYEPKHGTIGRAFPGVELRIADDGEVEARSEARFTGYLNDPEKTAETVDEDGWLKTGDLGRLDEDGYLTVTGRKKELIITAGGKNISPVAIESALADRPLIEQAIAIGDARRYITALVRLDVPAADAWAKENGIEFDDLGDLAEHPDLQVALEAEIKQANEQLARVEQVKKFKVVADDWTPGSGILTPTMKIRRHIAIDRYSELIEDMYAESPESVGADR
jgi:long-chain acyl-CoA synthetase